MKNRFLPGIKNLDSILADPLFFAELYQRNDIGSGDINSTETQTFKTNKLFDLCLLEELDDMEYIADVLGIYLQNTPAELMQLHSKCTGEVFEDAFIIAHKLKSSTGLLKANDLFIVLTNIEDIARAKTNGFLPSLAEQAILEFKKLETPLQEHLNDIQNRMRPAV